MTGPADAARSLIEAYVTGDRETVETLLSPDLAFTSPYDNGIDRDSYLRICWPNHEGFESVNIIHLFEHENMASMTYEAQFANGRAFRNSEIFTIKDGLVVAVEVYFGWELPHPVAQGEHDHMIGEKADA